MTARAPQQGTVTDFVIAQARPISVREVAECFSLTRDDALHFLRFGVTMQLLRVYRGVHGGGQRYVAVGYRPRLAVVDARTRMQPVEGERAWCARESQCLDEMMRIRPTARAASCPAGCTAFAPTPPVSGWQTAEHPIAKLQRLYGEREEEE